MNTRQLLSVGIDIGTTTTQVIFSHLELVNRAAVSQVPRYEFAGAALRIHQVPRTNSSNAKLAGKARCFLPLSINRVV